MSKRQGRLFTFGCSMTKYHWPTWADILGRQWEYFENWGNPGSGNTFIFDSLIECDTRNKFTPNDSIIVMWSGIARIDYYQQNRWSHMVNRFARDDASQPFSCPDGYEILSYPLFTAADQYLKSKNLNYKLCSFHSYDEGSRAGVLYKETLSKIKCVKFSSVPKKITRIKNNAEIELLYQRLSGKDWPSLDKILEKNFNPINSTIADEIVEFVQLIENDPHFKLTQTTEIDRHPLPVDHLNAIKDIAPDVTVDQLTVEWIDKINQQVVSDSRYYFEQHSPRERL